MKISPSLRRLVSLGCLLLASNALAKAPLVNVSVSPDPITNENQEATFTLSLSAPATHPIAVAFVMTGLAVQGFDYVLLGNFNKSGQAVIPAGQSCTIVTLHTLDDDPNPFREFATLNVVNGARYHVGSPTRASIFIFPQ